MKYGMLKEKSDSEEKCLSENVISENTIETSSGDVVAAVKTTENELSNEVLSLQTTESCESKVPLATNDEPVDYNVVVDKPELENPVICELSVNEPIQSEMPSVMPLEMPTQFEIIDESMNDVKKCEITEEIMDVVAGNEEEISEVDMITSPNTPSNDIDMSNMADVNKANYNFANAPIVELSRYSWGANRQKYLHGCIFSPDGTCVLTVVNKDGMHIVELPSTLYDNESVSADRPLDILSSAVHVPEGGTVYDYCWYPFMNSSSPETCCFISTRQHEPLQLWDAFDGKLRCTYRGYDAVDEVDSALSVCFSTDGSQVIAGYKKTLKIFRTNVPGRDYTNFNIKSPAACLAVNGFDENMIAIGSWNSFVTFHDTRSPTLTMTEKLVKHTGGITLMKFSSNGRRLVTGARKDNKLLVWDTRNVSAPLFCLNRNVETNQKIYFDLSSSEQWLVSGDTNGILHAYDLNYGTEKGKFPDYQYRLHHDCCNGVSLHPTRPIFATSSGQHHFIGFEEDIPLKSPKVQENSLIFWWCGQTA